MEIVKRRKSKDFVQSIVIEQGVIKETKKSTSECFEQICCLKSKVINTRYLLFFLVTSLGQIVL